MKQKILFIDRDGTLIKEPLDNFQVDHLNKLRFQTSVIPSLLKLTNFGFRLIMITNQDGLGTSSFSLDSFKLSHNMMLDIFLSQGVFFDDILICPHLPNDNCCCRKPKIALVLPWLINGSLDLNNSYVIGDRETDISLANNMGIKSFLYHEKKLDWQSICNNLLYNKRYANINRVTNETSINIELWLDKKGDSIIDTGINFFNHMLQQIVVHGGFCMNLFVQGDLVVDDHHTVEDTALAIGEAFKLAIGNKYGIGRFGFVLPMDDCLAYCALDISNRPYFTYIVNYKYRNVGDLSVDMIEHFFRSLSYSISCNLYLRAEGFNDHHKVESLFKAFGRSLRQAILVSEDYIPSSKGTL